MDPNNQTVNPKTPVTPQTPASQPPQAVPPNAPKSNKKLILWGFLGGLGVLTVIVFGGFYYFLSPKSDTKIVPTPKVEESAKAPEEEVAEVNGVSDLGDLLVELAEADDTLDNELTSFEKDSDF